MPVKGEWRRVPLGDHASVSARIGWKGLNADEYAAEGYRFLATPNIKGHQIDFDHVNFISERRFYESPELMLRPNDILLVKDGSTLGISNMVRALPSPATVNGSIALLRCSERLWPSFLHQLTKAQSFQKLIQDKKSGLGVPHLFQADLRKFEIPLPPLQEQVRMSEVLDTLDTTIRQTEAIIEKLKQVKQGLLHDLLTRGIDANGELRQTQSQAPHLYKDSPLGWIPREWQFKRFREIGRAPQLGLMVRGASPNGTNVGLLKMGNLLAGNQLDLSHVEPLDVRRIDRLDDYALADGDVLFNTRNTPELVGKTCSWRDRFGTTVFDNNILRMRVVPSVGNGHFIASYLGAASGRARLLGLATGTTSVAAIYWKDLQSFVLPLPEPQEQDIIVERLDACDRRADHEKAVAGTLVALKSGLMDDLLTGSVRVTSLLDTATAV